MRNKDNLEKLFGDSLQESSGILRSLAHPLRLKILKILDNEGSLSVHEIKERLGVEQSVTSTHLGILRMSGLVTPQRDKKYIFYTVNYNKLSNSVGAISKLESEEEFSPD